MDNVPGRALAALRSGHGIDSMTLTKLKGQAVRRTTGHCEATANDAAWHPRSPATSAHAALEGDHLARMKADALRRTAEDRRSGRPHSARRDGGLDRVGTQTAPPPTAEVVDTPHGYSHRTHEYTTLSQPTPNHHPPTPHQRPRPAIHTPNNLYDKSRKSTRVEINGSDFPIEQCVAELESTLEVQSTQLRGLESNFLRLSRATAGTHPDDPCPHSPRPHGSDASPCSTGTAVRRSANQLGDAAMPHSRGHTAAQEIMPAFQSQPTDTNAVIELQRKVAELEIERDDALRRESNALRRAHDAEAEVAHHRAQSGTQCGHRDAHRRFSISTREELQAALASARADYQSRGAKREKRYAAAVAMLEVQMEQRCRNRVAAVKVQNKALAALVSKGALAADSTQHDLGDLSRTLRSHLEQDA